MVETIDPVVHGGRNRRYWTASLLHVVGAAASAAAFGAALGGLGALLDAPWGHSGLIALVAVGVLYAARELLHAPIPLPDLDRQVPEWWRTFFSPNVAAFLYGLGLGIGFLTYLSFGTYAAVMVGAFISGDAATGAVICGAFGLARGIAVILVRGRSKGHVIDRLQVLAEGRRPALVNGFAILAIVGMALAAF